jgi:spherulation-specific family 4 protein
LTGVIIPFYTYPTDGSWNALVAAHNLQPTVEIIAVVNPNSGPDTAVNLDYVTGIAKLQAVGIRALGYVDTLGGGVPIASAKLQASKYWSWYKVDGVFWDNFSNYAGQEAYYANLTGYVDGMMGAGALSVGNPGMRPPLSYDATVDFLVTFENAYLPPAGFLGNYIAYAVSSLPTTFPLPAWLYLTDLSGGNPYNALPSYFTQLLAKLAGPSPPPPPPPTDANDVLRGVALRATVTFD